MSPLNKALQGIAEKTDGVLGVAVIGISTRKLVGVAQPLNHLSPATMEAVAVSAVEMVRGKAVSAVELLLSESLGTPVESCIDELCINTKVTRIFIATVQDKPDFLMVLSTDTSINMAMGWMLVRRNMPLITEELT